MAFPVHHFSPFFFLFCALLISFGGYSKQLLKLLKTRIDTIRKKRNAVHKYLRSDVAELLKSGLDVNAYGRVIFFISLALFWEFLLKILFYIFGYWFCKYSSINFQ